MGSVPLTMKEKEEKSSPTSVHRQTSEFDSIQSVEVSRECFNLLALAPLPIPPFLLPLRP